MSYRFADSLRAGSGRNEFSSNPANPSIDKTEKEQSTRLFLVFLQRSRHLGLTADMNANTEGCNVSG